MIQDYNSRKKNDDGIDKDEMYYAIEKSKIEIINDLLQNKDEIINQEKIAKKLSFLDRLFYILFGYKR